MENEKKIVYSKYFNKKIHNKMIRKEKEFNFFYHIVITYNNEKHYNNVFKHIFNNNKNLISFNWVCGTKRKFNSSANNRHKKRYHSHSVIFSDHEIQNPEEILKTYKDFLNLDIKIISGYDLENLLNYIFDGHHIYKSYKIIKKIKRKIFRIKTILKKLRISNSEEFKIQKVGLIMKT